MSQNKQKVAGYLSRIRCFKHYLPYCYPVAREMVESRKVWRYIWYVLIVLLISLTRFNYLPVFSYTEANSSCCSPPSPKMTSRCPKRGKNMLALSNIKFLPRTRYFILLIIIIFLISFSSYSALEYVVTVAGIIK